VSRSPHSIGRRKPIYISSDDPRAANKNVLERYRANAGAEVIVVPSHKPFELDPYVPPPDLVLWSLGTPKLYTSLDSGKTLTFYNLGMDLMWTPNAAAPLYNGSVFVFADLNGRVMTSHYFSQHRPASSEVYFRQGSSMLYANGKMVFADAVVGNISVTEDLVSLGSWVIKQTFTAIDAGLTTISSMAYGNGVYVAISANKAYTSADLISWSTNTLSGFIANAWQVAFFNDKFIAIDSAGSILISLDGLTWTAPTYTPLIANYAFLTVGSDKAIIVGPSDGSYLYSTDGITWENGSFAFPDVVAIVYVATYSNGSFFVMPWGGVGPLLISTDAIVWSMQTLPETEAGLAFYAISSKQSTHWDSVFVD
jgi:hypothetical protein